MDLLLFAIIGSGINTLPNYLTMNDRGQLVPASIPVPPSEDEKINDGLEKFIEGKDEKK